VSSPIVRTPKERELDDGRERVKDLFDWYTVAFSDFSEGKEFLARLSYIDDSEEIERLD
jgi:hypothetical protein